jgi:hypothetical protein
LAGTLVNPANEHIANCSSMERGGNAPSLSSTTLTCTQSSRAL